VPKCGQGSRCCSNANLSWERLAGGGEGVNVLREAVANLQGGFARLELARAELDLEKTVESHMAAAFRKLGIRSRAELARQLADPDDEP
jgi:regulatory LuxR family protein